MIIIDVPRKTKCVDDCVLWDDNVMEHWWRVCDYLELVGRNGIILNPKKFQFGQRNIDFAGFHITQTEVKPLQKYLDSILSFPQPKRTEDIRRWFGLVNQVMHYNKLTPFMAPIRHLLSPKNPFVWTAELENAFQTSKVEIVNAIKHGVTIFDPARKSCLCTDWSKTGVGYFLRQKFCKCDSDLPTCCPDGWNVTLANSRFLRDAEQRWAPVEGEALAIAWGLHDSKYFTLGCDDLVVVTDQKPLIRVFNDRKFDEITNERIFRLKQKTLMWRFKTVHIPGKKTPAADALSRYPSSYSDEEDTLRVDELEETVVASIQAAVNKVQSVTWENVRNSTASDPDLQQLKQLIINGFPPKSSLPGPLHQYWKFREGLSIVDDVIMYENRAVIPVSLRANVCKNIHSAHQGVSTMLARALASYFWPGITTDIQREREGCMDCWNMAPSQQDLPPIEPHIPTSPFESIAADYCKTGGYHYLITVDRFSNWPEVLQVKPGSTNSGSAGLIKALKRNFATFGVPVELSSDGGSEFDSDETQDFLQRWGVQWRLSSAYHPKSNGRAEVAVRSMKRLLETTVSRLGEIDTDAYTQAILQFRNTPNSYNGVSPAEIIFGRTLRDTLPVKPRTQVFNSDLVRDVWTDAWSRREQELVARSQRQMETLSEKCKEYGPLIVGDQCFVQNQTGLQPKRWDRQGQVVEVLDYNQYLVRLNGSRRLTLRNRKYLRKIPPTIQPREQAHTYAPTTPNPMKVSPTPTPTPAPKGYEQLLFVKPATSDHHHHEAIPVCSAPPTIDPSLMGSPTRSPDPPLVSPNRTPISSRLRSTNTDDPSPQTTPQTTPPTPPLVSSTPPRDNGGQGDRVVAQRPSRDRRAPLWQKDYEMGGYFALN